MIDLIIKLLFGAAYILVMLWVFGVSVDRLLKATSFKDYLILSLFIFILIFMILLGAVILAKLTI